MEAAFLGGAEAIGGSCAVLDVDGTRVLIDCGQRLGAAQGLALPDLSYLEFGPPIEAVLLTHAHTDHIGGLPALEPHLAQDCAILGTAPTLALARVMLEDSLRIMAEHRKGDDELPLFSRTAVTAVIKRFQSVRWGKAQRLGDSSLLGTWFPAGHILGAAMIEIRGKDSSALISGDVCAVDQLTVPGLFAPAIRPDLLVLESTYGNRLHAHRPAQEERIVERVKRCVAAGGNVLFPTFALGRAQEILLLLGRAMRQGTLDGIPVYADGLVRAVSKVYVRFPDDLSQHCRRLWEQALDPVFPQDLPIRPVRNGDERTAIVKGRPCVVVSSSGMLQGGASQFYASHWLGQERNLVLLTGYQDEESPGQALLDLLALPPDQPRFIALAGVRMPVRCQVESCMLSAHADGGELVALATKLQPRLILPVHGDSEARQALARSLMAHTRAEVVVPAEGQPYVVPPASTTRSRTSERRITPLALWPPWDPVKPRELDLARIHAWLDGMEPRVSWLLLDELAELWKSPAPLDADDWTQLRRAVYEQPQPYFLPDSRRPYMLHVARSENLAKVKDLPRLGVERATAIVRELFPPDSGLVRFGFFPETGELRLEFRFPGGAHQRYVRRLGELARRTGWKLDIPEDTADGDLLEVLAAELRDDHAEIQIDHAARAVRVAIPLGNRPDELESLSERFSHLTGYRLDLELTGLAS